MLRVRQIKTNQEDNENEIIKQIEKKLKAKIIDYKIHKKSIDARKGIKYVYEVDVNLKNEDKIKLTNDIIKVSDETYKFKITGKEQTNIIIVGTGPAGLFSAYILAQNGYKPLIIERGKKVEERIKDVQKFWDEGILNENSNVQFGEGGAGTFSDGKLNTQIKDKEGRKQKVLEIFVQNGAPKEILYENKPHIGTDLLRKVIPNIRNQIIKMGGKFEFETKLEDIITKENKLDQIKINGKYIPCKTLILAIGHSSRDTFEMLSEKINIASKPFAIGVRIQHPQKLINESQYGKNTNLKPASYKLTYKAKNKGVYTFCMCPGGYVVNASSEKDMLAINGMSNYERESENANSAIIVTVNEKDYGTNPLDGIKFQREIEAKAYTKGQGKIPVQLLEDFYNNQTSKEFKEVKPIFKGNYTFANINEILPQNICEALKEAIKNFDTKIKNYNKKDAIIAGVETRTSSPVQITRDENFEASIKGIYPCGEGAGYAGGITSAAIDGLKVSEKIAQKYKPY